ncbi:hypothetical protein [Antarcticimicrobium sediminis]|uniref:Uncharacterized protein n=1 Tax=Antarcticimicrobium sediminis TaxID=2546227 RepID=A0A4R5F0X2_9RHOB|nr:hypothetical protein [Antarcticimicrobium sediminis]TDE41061.1 hypothetical protein E1B25_02280 [Antarcticimicrobium sediminis]
MIFRILFLILSFALTGPAAAAPSGGYGGGGAGGGGGDGSVGGISGRVTKSVMHSLNNGFNSCQRFKTVYRFDCYRQVYMRAANQMAGIPAYRPARLALEGVKDTLDQIVARHADPTASRSHQGFQSYRAITPEAVPAAKRDLTRALEEAETTLLRSAGQSNSHFTSIAQAVHSNKVLLRSALLEMFGPVLALLD